jgi:hypothetical protein
MITTIQFKERDEAILALKSSELLIDIEELRDRVRGHLKYQEPLTVDDIYTQLNEILSRYQ